MTPLAVSVIEHTAFSLLQPVASPLINAITGKGVRRAEKGQEGGIILLLPLPLAMKLHLGRGCNNMEHMGKNVESCSTL